jgi:hypothetical protein
MGPSSCKSTVTTSGLLLCVVVSFLAELVHGHGGLVPALYVLGDSQADVGNNNQLELSPLRANFPRNGIDYPGQQATGRFSNGYNFVDFLGMNCCMHLHYCYLLVCSAVLINSWPFDSNLRFWYLSIAFASLAVWQED